MSVYTQQVPFVKAAAPPGPGNAVGFNVRATEAGGGDQTGETWVTNSAIHPWPTDFSLVGGGTHRGGWDGNTGSAFDTGGVSDRRLKGGVGLAPTGTNGNGVFVLSGADSGTSNAAGTYRVRCAIGLYVTTNVQFGFYDGYTFNGNGVDRGTLRWTVGPVTCQANEWTNVDGVARNEASWVSTYDSIYQDIIVTDQGVNTALVCGKEPSTYGQWQYVAHLQVEKIA